MSVPKHRRTESKLEVQTKARELAKYTTTICANEKVFPKRDRWIVTNRIVTTALTIMEEVDTANDIYVSTKGDFELRRRSQTIALSSTSRLLGLMELAFIKYNIEERRIEHWTQLVADTRELIKKWRQSDMGRYRRERCVMFKKMTTEELLQEERKRNMELLNKQSDLENALLELAEIVATEGVEEDGEAVL